MYADAKGCCDSGGKECRMRARCLAHAVGRLSCFRETAKYSSKLMDLIFNLANPSSARYQ